jgi:hypothetical protein
MKIAFDVKGTLYGENEKNVRRLYEAFKTRGHTLFVWSNSIGYASSAVRDLDLNVEYMSKFLPSERDYDKNQYMDICVEDDRNQKYLASKAFIFVDQITDDTDLNFLIENAIQEALDAKVR